MNGRDLARYWWWWLVLGLMVGFLTGWFAA